jgi:predicted membrane protein
MIAQPALFTLGDKLFYTILHGTILETAPGQTVVKTQITTGILFKFLFVFILAIGTACFYHSIRQLSPVIFIVGAVMFFVCPFIVNWMAGFSKAVVQDRYERYIHKAVKSLTSA